MTTEMTTQNICQVQNALTWDEVCSDEMHERAVQAAVCFLKRIGELEIVEVGEKESKKFDIVGKNGAEIVFVDVDTTASDKGYSKLSSQNRASKEMRAAQWLIENQPESNTLIRFDQISLMILNGKQAMVRYNKNCLLYDKGED